MPRKVHQALHGYPPSAYKTHDRRVLAQYTVTMCNVCEHAFDLTHIQHLRLDMDLMNGDPV